MHKGLRLFGGRLKVNLWLFPAIALLIVFGMGDVVLIYIPVLIVHEWAHIAAAAALGVSIDEMELLPFGCAAKLSYFAMPRSREMIVAAAGPAINMVMASAVFLLNEYAVKVPIAEKLITANISIAAVNLLPALPLDGGRIARAAFASFLGIKRATRITGVAGIFLSAVFAALGIYIMIKGVMNPSFLILAFFLCVSAIGEMRSVSYALICDISSKREAIKKSKTLCVHRFAAMQTDKISDILREFEAGKYNIVTVLGRDMGVLDELDERTVLDGMMEHGTGTTLRSLCRRS